MKIGMPITLKQIDIKSDSTIKYYCKVIDYDESSMYVDYPINMETNKTELIDVNRPFIVGYIINKVAFEFESNDIKQTVLNIPALKISIPEDDQIRKIQRREFVRIDTNVDVAIHCPDNSFAPFTTVSQDVSGGGAAIIIPSKSSIKHGQIVDLYFVFNIRNKQFTYINTQAKIIRMSEQDLVQSISVGFLELDTKDQEKIVSYCFEKQREARKQNLI